MLKKIASIALLLVLLSSFTAGSVSYEKADQSTFMPARMHGFLSPLACSVIYPVTAPASSTGGTIISPITDTVTTTMIFDMSGSQFVWSGDGSPAEPGVQSGMIAAHGPVHGEGGVLSNTTSGYITGKVILYRSDSTEPRSYPVKWERNNSGMPDHPGPQSVFSAHMKFSKNSMGEIVPVTAGTVMIGVSGGVDGAEIIEVNSDIIVNDSLLAAAVQTAISTDVYDNTIVQGQDTYHSVDVSSAITSLNIDLKWNNTDNDLRLMIYTPDGHILGPYTDTSDGNSDGRVNINVSNTEGLANGEWYLKVTGSDVMGTDDYYIRTY